MNSKALLLAGLLALGLSSAHAGGVGQATASQATVTRSLTLNLGGVPSRAELTLPAGQGKAPLVLLIQGTGLEDLNGSYATFGGGRVPGSLGELAHALTRAGFAVMRFDKRHAAASFDPQTAPAASAAYGKLKMTDLLADARTALNTAKAQPGVDPGRVFVYGWSEGSVLAAHLALETGAGGLIVQGPVVEGYGETFAHQFERVGLTYLAPYAPGGSVDLQGVLAALTGPGSGLAKMQAQLLLSLDSTPQAPKLSTVLDTDGDGRINLRGEALPLIQTFYRSLDTQPGFYGPGSALPTLGALAPRLKLPVLILQGANDGNIDPASAQKLDAALGAGGNTDHTLRLYPGLGHSLGPAPSFTQDTFAPMAQGPMNDMASWLRAHTR
ncbi:hypothetical protein DEIPH_ctg012orf0106 [Deinococcus phoenicis]|uniref:Serine aminopeptidase S33 domain-containing protein n=1 Tax=Deinococcus phoenicis TaxID=1476583 RepID=A0A016QSU1_9DEIO|nr:alpha/beta hydrolase [Deinococcus phoenicis]EYB69031.1 hypothetical protein DEIPH_ctg012orf0106 [Deinococcus phoenicis]